MISSSMPEFTVPSTGDDNNATLETELGSSIGDVNVVNSISVDALEIGINLTLTLTLTECVVDTTKRYRAPGGCAHLKK